MSQDLPATLDVPALVTNLSVLVLAVSAVIAGIYKALKTVNEGEKKPSPPQEVKAAMLVETATMAHWTESNRVLGEKIERLVGVCTELCHQVERLRDKL